MMPDIEREERRKKRAPVIAFILFGMLVVAALVQPGWQWVPFAAISPLIGKTRALPCIGPLKCPARNTRQMPD